MGDQTAENDQILLTAFDAITEAAAPDDWTRHLPNCGYTHEVPECGCSEWGGKVRAALTEALTQARHQALRDAADAWTQGAWSDVMLPKPTPPAVPVIAYSNRFGDWLRRRAGGLTTPPGATS